MNPHKPLCSWCKIDTFECQETCLNDNKVCEYFDGLTSNGKYIICTKPDEGHREEIES